MQFPSSPPPDHPASLLRAHLGSTLGTLFDVVAQAPADADVDLSVACMFEHEFRDARLDGGLLHLDQALGGALTCARRSGHFRAHALESLLVARPPAQIRARAMLIIGLGDPDAIDESVLSRACSFAVSQAERLQARTAAFTPNLLDAGVVARPGLRVAHAMLSGAFSALALSDRLCKQMLAPPSPLRAWSFGAGAEHFANAVPDFRQAFAPLSADVETKGLDAPS